MAARLPDMTTLLAPGAQPLPSLLSARRLKNQKLARTLRFWVPAGLLIALFFMCFICPHIYSIPPGNTGSILAAQEPPFSPGHWLGTDPDGGGIFSTLVSGGPVAVGGGVAAPAGGIG